ncbi:ERF family protein [Novosphingobium sp. MBES04]|uniref:ERF family protein n=1 Tax=Novosphingobium sp. MBES04 TaxID=1206458 RepID=UPI000694A8A0|nr:ERF family protein [Novosphingobium sp. MBES04]GAM06358.1 single-stranded DNA-binding protein [Novosphingobium sp. MBES04]
MNAQTKIEAAAVPAVYGKIAAVQADIAREGISKERQNSFDRYNFRGIDDVYNALSPILAKHGLNILPRIIERDCQERQSKKGDAMFYVTVTAEFDLIAAEDGSKHTIRTYGEAMDRADKATNKAMSAAYKYAAFMAFAIPTDGDNDADSDTPQVEPRQSRSTGMPDDAFAKLGNLLRATNTTPAVICDHYKVKDLRRLNGKQHAEIVERLEQRLAAMAKEDTNRAGQSDGSDFNDIDPADLPF